MFATSSVNILATAVLMFATRSYGQSTSPSDLINCLNNAKVPITIPGDDLYTNESYAFNIRLQYKPAAVALPATPDDVSAAVICAKDNGVKVQAKGGGHSYTSYSSGGQNGSLVLSMEKFGNVTLDSNYVAAVGAGQRLGNMALAIYNQSHRALPHGSCPGVGIGGHATHGGYNYPSRKWGLTLDTIVGLDVVLANGSFVRASEDESPDLFYALRGAADSFGIITTFYLQTQPAPDSIVYWHYDLDPSVLNGSGVAAADALAHIQDFALNSTVMCDDLGFGVHIAPGALGITGIYYGSQDDYVNYIKPELLRTLPPSNETLETVDWPTLLDLFAGYQGPVSQPLGPAYPQHDDFYANSLLSPQASPITHDAWVKYFQYIIQNQNLGGNSTWYSIIDLYGGPGSLINKVAPDATSFPHRSSLFSFQHYSYTGDYSDPFPSNIIPFTQGLNDVLPNAMPNVEWPSYINYIDSQLTAAEAHAVYFGNETYSRLLSIKNEVDPTRVFWNPQAVGI